MTIRLLSILYILLVSPIISAQDGISIYFTKGIAKDNFTSFNRFAESYNSYAKQNAIAPLTKPFDIGKPISTWGFGANISSKRIYTEIGYGRLYKDNTAEFKSGSQHIEFISNNFEFTTALGIGFSTKNNDCGFIGAGFGFDVHRVKLKSHFDFPNEIQSYGEDHFVNGIYMLALNSILKAKGSIRIMIPIKYFSIFSRIDYIFGNEDSRKKTAFQDNMKGVSSNGYDITRDLPEDMQSFTDGNFSTQSVYPNYRGWTYQFGITFNFLRES